jgi:Rrf2 family protein
MLGPRPISEKSRYGLRALFELSLRNAVEPVKIQDIASSQRIPQRFLEVILAELKHGGFVQSRRGNDGGYSLARSPAEITLGEVLEFMQGRNGKYPKHNAATYAVAGDYAFGKLWETIAQALGSIYDNTTLADLVEQELAARRIHSADYII